MDSLEAQERVGDFLKRLPRIRRAVRTMLRVWERGRTARRLGPHAAISWQITRTAQMLPISQFGATAVNHIGAQPHTSRLYAVHVGSRTTLAAAAFEHGAGPGGALLLTEFALSRPVDYFGGGLDPLAYMAGIFLLEQLHDVASKLMRPTELWLESCTGAKPVDLLTLGFEHTGFSSEQPDYRRLDSADPWARILGWWKMLERWIRR